MIRAIRICAHTCMILHIHRDNSRIVVKKGHFWAFFTFSNCVFTPLLLCAMVILPHGTVRIPMDSLAFWLQIPPIPIWIRSAVAEIWSISQKTPCFFWLQNCVFTPLLLCSMGILQHITRHTPDDRYTSWLQNEILLGWIGVFYAEM